mmetsp:Transcript_31849/g.98386  ORF Transcript_31849/g.98386 Transcript_31849/m.98386 type:complete len:90 (-) Transcript_31849:3166-3435(-)
MPGKVLLFVGGVPLEPGNWEDLQRRLCDGSARRGAHDSKRTCLSSNVIKADLLSQQPSSQATHPIERRLAALLSSSMLGATHVWLRCPF